MRYVIADTGEAGDISTDHLIGACDSLRDQYDLQMAASDKHEQLPTLDAVMRGLIQDNDTLRDIVDAAVDTIVENRINSTTMLKNDGTPFGRLLV